MDVQKTLWLPLILSFLFQSFIAISVASQKGGSDHMTESSLVQHRVRREFNMFVYAQGSGPVYNNRTMSANTYPGTGNSGGTSYSGYSGGSNNPSYAGKPYVPPSPYSPGIYGGGGTPYRPPAPYNGYSGSPYTAPPAPYGYNTPQKIRNYETPGYSAGYSNTGTDYSGGYTSPGSEDADYGRSPASYAAKPPSTSTYAGSRTQPTYNMQSGSGALYTGSTSSIYSNRSTGSYSTSYKSAGCDCPRDSFMYDVVYEMNECNGVYPFYCSSSQCAALKEQNSIIPGLGYAIYVPEQVSLPLCALGRKGYEVFDIAACARQEWKWLGPGGGGFSDRSRSTFGREGARGEVGRDQDRSFPVRDGGRSISLNGDRNTFDHETGINMVYGRPENFANRENPGITGNRFQQSSGTESGNQQRGNTIRNNGRPGTGSQQGGASVGTTQGGNPQTGSSSGNTGNAQSGNQQVGSGSGNTGNTQTGNQPSGSNGTTGNVQGGTQPGGSSGNTGNTQTGSQQGTSSGANSGRTGSGSQQSGGTVGNNGGGQQLANSGSRGQVSPSSQASVRGGGLTPQTEEIETTFTVQCSPPLKVPDPVTENLYLECLTLNPFNNMVVTTGNIGCDAFRSCNTKYRCNIIVYATLTWTVVAESKDIQLTLSTDCTGCHYCPETKESCLPRKYNYSDLGYGNTGYSQTSNYNPYG